MASPLTHGMSARSGNLTPLTWRSVFPLGWRGTLLIVAVCLLGACASFGRHPSSDPTTAFVAVDDGSVFARYAPVFLHQNDSQSFNRVGRPTARYDHRGKERVYVDPTAPTVYVQERQFTGVRGDYTNLIYRVHFERVPVRWVPFHLTAGRNIGLLVIVTLDGGGRPVLLTTVHTCGCYLAFVPTALLPADAYPEDWDSPTQKVFGEALPSQVPFASDTTGVNKLGVFLRDGTHRVMDVGPLDLAEVRSRYHIADMSIAPMEALKVLPLNGGTTSFYRTEGPRQGYVKNTIKPFELLLLSWWAWDINVGVDKEYGDPGETGTVFYTSLKPWRRKASDMWAFADFLTYWGWTL